MIIDAKKPHEHDDWECSTNHHAAEIATAYTDNQTEASHTGDTTMTDVTNAVLTSGSFVDDGVYLIIAHCMWHGDNGNGVFAMQTLHGSTAFENNRSLYQKEFRSGGNAVWYDYTFCTVFTQPATAEEIQIQFRPVSNTGDTVFADNIALFAMRLDEDLTLNTDYFTSTRVASDTLSTTETATNASVTLPSGTTDWWAFASGDMINGAINVNMISHLFDGTTSRPEVSDEGEDTADINLQCVSKIFESAESLTLSQRTKVASGTAGTREFSEVFALDLSVFAAHGTDHTEADILSLTLATAFSGGVTVATTSVNPTSTGLVWSLGYLTYEVNGTGTTSGLHARYQIQNADQPAGQTTFFDTDGDEMYRANDGGDRYSTFFLTRDSLTSGAKTGDIDAYREDSPAAGSDLGDRSLIMVWLELAAAAVAIPVVNKHIGVPDTYGGTVRPH